jgi:hypothetical protein
MNLQKGREIDSPGVQSSPDEEAPLDRGPARAAAHAPSSLPGRLPGFALLVVELALILVIVYRFEIAAQNHFFPVLCILVGGFLIHVWIPAQLRAAFFGLLSLGGLVFYLGGPNAAAVIGIGGGLIAVCYLPISFALRVTLIALAAFALVLLRMDFDQPFWPVLGSMFMFRLIVYLYELRRTAGRPPLDLTVAYFFPLPNVCFLFFPILDFKTFRETYRPDASWAEAQTGVAWIARGLMHLLLYRVVKYYLLPAPHEMGDVPHLALFLAANYALYLHVSGYFHIITGIFHLFGFGLPRTHHNYFLASSFTDIWRRINIYWKDFMAKLFFFPAFYALRGWGTPFAVAAGALWVFLASWLLHAFQVFWITGGIPLRLYDAVLWLAAGVLVAVNMQLDIARAGRPASRRRGPTILGALGLSLRVVGMFALVSLFWAAWNTPYFFAFVRAQPLDGPDALAGAAVVLGVLLTAVAAGTVAQLVRSRLMRLKLLPLNPSPAASAVGLTAALAAVALLGTPAVTDTFSPGAKAVLASLRQETASAVEAAQAVQGYYEEITAARAKIGPWLAGLEGRPVPAGGTHYPELTRPADAWLERELIPGWSGDIVGGSRLSINRFGMRDRPDLTQQKPPGTCRLAMVGTSVVMGYRVNDSEPFPRLLEDRLNAGRRPGAPRCQVLNFGAGMCYAIHRHVLIDRKVFTFEPDAIYYFAHQDEFQGTIEHLAKLAVAGAALPYPGLADVVRKAGVEPGMPPRLAEAKLTSFAREVVLCVYRDLVAECRRRGVLPVWVYLPMPGVTDTPVQATFFVTVAAEAGFTVISLDDWADGHSPAEVKPGPAEHHPNALGHRLIAERLDHALRERPERLPACARE